MELGELFLVEESDGRAAHGDGSPRGFVEFGRGDAQLGGLAIVRGETRCATAVHGECEQDELTGLFGQCTLSLDRTHECAEGASGLDDTVGGRRRGCAVRVRRGRVRSGGCGYGCGGDERWRRS
jgi:hypothetical protein